MNKRGQLIVISGFSGAGKSTLIRLVNRLETPDEGTVEVAGQQLDSLKGKSLSALRRKIGMVFQQFNLLDGKTVYHNVAVPLILGHRSPAEIEKRVTEVLEFVELSESVLEMSPFELSGGQKRRVAIAGVIAMEPDVLILDEPTAGLDPKGREQILSNIRAYQTARNATVIMVSHSMEEIADSVERLVVIHDAHIAMDGTPREVFTHARDLESMGLAVPQVTNVFLRLRELGLDVDTSVYTTEQARSALLALKGGAC